MHGADKRKPYISHIVDLFSDADERVRCAAIKTMLNMEDLPQDVVEEHSSAIYKCTTHPSEEMKAHLLSYEPHNEDHAHSEKLIVHYEGT